MKKILISICLLFATISFAEDKKEYNLQMMHYPMMCGLPADVDRYIVDNEFTPINVSFGKENANENGNIVFAITYYINDKHQTLAVAETPNDPYKCMIFHTFDMQMNTNLLKPGLQT